ncbi:MAG: hypothetical protein IJ106_04910 [Parasporobacterium sp.]|nr:hypothetical protein [Parasporobacterium sp.]
MDYSEFKVDVKQCVSEKIRGRNAEVITREVVKANDMKRDSIFIMEEGSLTAPTLYLNDFYEVYQNGGTIGEISDRIIEIHDYYSRSAPPQFQDFEDFSKAKEHITCRLLNTAVNRRYLEETPHLPFLDLSIVFYCTVTFCHEREVYSSKITDRILTGWGKDVQDLYKIALNNTSRLLGTYLKEVKEVFREILDQTGLEEDPQIRTALDGEDRTPMFILSNRSRSYGAACILDQDLMRRLSEKLKDDLYIIPSSVHEVLLIPAHSGLSRQEADEMVRNVNRSILEPADLLSDHVYLYSGKQQRITC